MPVHCNQRMIGVNNVYRRGHDSALYVSPRDFQVNSHSTQRFLLQQPDQYLQPRVKAGRNSRPREGACGQPVEMELRATEKCKRMSFRRDAATASRAHSGHAASPESINLTDRCTDCCATDASLRKGISFFVNRATNSKVQYG